MTDLILAILHHFLVFSLAGVLFAETVLLRPGLGGRWLALLANLDRMYGGLAVAIIVIGVGRVVWGARGWEYYVGNHAFWGKMAAFLIVGLLSIKPTLRIIAWQRAAKGEAGYLVPDAEVSGMKTFLRAELAFLALILVFAAMMARGGGY